jgi:predicted dehydrogenase
MTQAATSTLIRWGILGTGKIAKAFATALQDHA